MEFCKYFRGWVDERGFVLNGVFDLVLGNSVFISESILFEGLFVYFIFGIVLGFEVFCSLFKVCEMDWGIFFFYFGVWK